MTKVDLEELEKAAMSGDEIEEQEVIQKFQRCMDELKQNLSSKSRTAKLWLQYIEYISIMRQYIRAARTGDWNLSLITLQKMINLFAATGHINYAKSARFYLQLMVELPTPYLRLYNKLSSEGH